MNLSSLVPVLAIDGPSGTGKGAIGSAISRTRSWNFLDSGALYRAFAFAADELHIPPGDIEKLTELSKRDIFVFKLVKSGEVNILVDGQDVSTLVRSERGGQLASRYAAEPAVRRVLISQQRGRRESPGLVADGRDMGTIVFPDATLKIFLTASPEIRAERRYKQLKKKDFNVTLSSLSASIAERDEKDASRTIAPLVAAPDAIVIDSSGRSIRDVLEEVDGLLSARLRNYGGNFKRDC
jgi:cytidylate kinase